MATVKRLSSPSGAGGPHVAVVAERLLRQVRDALAEQDWDGLRTSHFRLLTCVPAEGITITELAAELFMTKQAAGQFVTQLRRSGHLHVTTDPGDRRRRVVVRTATGDRTVTAVAATVAAVEQQWARRVGAERYRLFRAVLTELTEGSEPVATDPVPPRRSTVGPGRSVPAEAASPRQR